MTTVTRRDFSAADADFERLRITRLQADDRRTREAIETAAVGRLGRDAFLEAVAEGGGVTDEQALSEDSGAEAVGTIPASPGSRAAARGPRPARVPDANHRRGNGARAVAKAHSRARRGREGGENHSPRGSSRRAREQRLEQ